MIVIVKFPVAALRLGLMVMVDVPAPVIDVGLKLTLVPFPIPEAERLIEELKPPTTVVVTVTVPVLFLATVIDVGDALIEKLAATPVTVSVTVVVCVKLPEVPVTVIG